MNRQEDLEASFSPEKLDLIKESAPEEAEYYDTFWKCYLRVIGGVLHHFEDNIWKYSKHKDGVRMINNGECLDIRVNHET